MILQGRNFNESQAKIPRVPPEGFKGGLVTHVVFRPTSRWQGERDRERERERDRERERERERERQEGLPWKQNDVRNKDDQAMW